MISEHRVMFGLIRSAVCGADPDEETVKAADRETLEKIYDTAAAHGVAQIIGDQISRLGLLQQDDEVYKKYKSQLNLAIYQTTMLDHWHDQIKKVLNDAGIAFIPIKGATIRNLYAKGFYRMSCDIDVLIHEENLDRGVSALTEKLGMKAKPKSSHDVSLYFENKVHLELHYDTVEKGRISDSDKVLSKIWEYADNVSGSEYDLSDDMQYFYLLAHTAKHLKNGGCGIKAFIDIYLMNNVIEFDSAKREALLREGGMEKFDSRARALCDYWFGCSESDQTTEYFSDFVISGGRYGTLENSVSVQRSNSGGFKYIISRIFVSYDTIKYNYPVLLKHKWLYPFMLIRRTFKMFRKSTRKRSSKELKYSLKLTKKQQQDSAEFFSDLGI